jgi:hypothetical protein
MISVDVDTKDLVTTDIKRIRRELAAVPKAAHTEFVALTPIRLGNARRSTNLVGDQIQANYAYATRLDQGYSKQAPRGIIRPWEIWFRRRIRQIMGR